MKTEDEIERERQQVAKLIGAKSAIEAALDRCSRLENALRKAICGLQECKKATSAEVKMGTYALTPSGLHPVHNIIDHYISEANKVL